MTPQPSQLNADLFPLLPITVWDCGCYLLHASLMLACLGTATTTCIYMYMYYYSHTHDNNHMWCQRVCNCRVYSLDLVLPHQYSAAQHTYPWYHLGLHTQDYPEQLWFPLNEIHQPQLLSIN